MFSPGKSGQEICGFEISLFPESLCRDPGKCLYISKDFSGAIYIYASFRHKKCVSSAILQSNFFFPY